MSSMLKKSKVSGEELSKLEETYYEHIDMATELQSQMKKDLEVAINDIEMETLTFDLQKTHPIPKLRVL